MRQIKKGSTDQSVVIRIVDSTAFTPEEAVEHNTSGISLWYRREGATLTSMTANLTALSALNDAHTDYGIEHIDDGYYRLDLPDAAFATGANGVMVGGTVTGMIVIGCYVHLVDFDPQDAVRQGMTALPNAAADAAGGLPISDAGGLDLDAKIGALTFTVAGDVDCNIQSVGGAALSTSAAQIGVNVIQAAGTAWGSGAITAASIAGDAITEAKIADDAIGNEHWNVSAVAGCAVSSIGNDVITAASIQAAAIDFATFAADCKTGTGLKANVESISANAITATAINADAITAAKIADDAISSEHINTGAITADAFAADAIVAATLATGAITADAFAADAIVAATLATGAITADAFAADAIVAATLATGAITADAFAADAIVAATLATGAITAAKFAAGAIDAAAIAAGAIDAATFAADVDAEIAAMVWDAATASYGSAGSYGEALEAVGAAADPWLTNLPGAYGAGTAGYIIGTGSTLTAGDIADAVWDEAQSGHVGAGTFGEVATEVASILDDTGSAGVVVAAASKTGYTLAATTGLGNQTANITGTVSGNSTHTAANVWEVATRVLTANTNLNDPTAATIADAVWDEAATGHTDAGKAGAQMWTDIDAILDDTDLIDDGTSGLAKIATDVAAILVDTAVIGAAGAGLTAVPWNAAWDAEVQSECTDALNAYDPPTNAEMEARTLAAAAYATAAALTVVDGIVDDILVDTGTTLDALLKRVAVVCIGDVTQAGTAEEIFVYGGVTATVTVDEDGNRSIAWS